MAKLAMQELDATAHLNLEDEVNVAMLRALDQARSEYEVFRAKRRNRNRVLMIVAAWICSLLIPFIGHLLHSTLLAEEAAGIGFSADILVTGYSWIRNY